MKSSLSLLILFTCLSVFAQNQKGNFIIGGNLNTGSIKGLIEASESQITLSNINLDAKFGYFISNQWLLGSDSHFRYSQTVFSRTGSKSYGTSFHIFPYLRRYLKKSKIPLFGFVNGGFSYSFANSNTGISQKNHFWKAETGIGANLFISKNIALESTISFFRRKGFKGNSVSSNGEHGLALNFDFQYFFNRNQEKNIPDLKAIYLKKGNYSFSTGSNFSVTWKQKQEYINFAPSVQYFLTDRLEVGSGLGIEYDRGGGFFHATSDINISPNLRYYFRLKEFFYMSFGIFGTVNRQQLINKTFGISGGATKISSIFWRKEFSPKLEMLLFCGKKTIFRAVAKMSYIHLTHEQIPTTTFSNFGWEAGIEHFLTPNISILISGDNTFSKGRLSFAQNTPEFFEYSQSAFINCSFQFFIRGE